MGRLQKKGVSIFLAIIFALSNIWAGVPTINAKAAEASEEDGGNENGEETTLGVATNLRWKEGSSATAMWDAVDGANYYEVRVVVKDINGAEIGEKSTGTTETVLDVQQEIMSVDGVDNITGTNVKVSFSVKAVSNNTEGNSVYGNESEMSCEKLYNIKDFCKLETPKNVHLSDDFILSWDNLNLYNINGVPVTYRVYLNVDGCERDFARLMYGYDGSTFVNGTLDTYYEINSDGTCYADLSFIKDVIFYNEDYSDTIKITMKMMTSGHDTYYDVMYFDSDFSDYTETIQYKQSNNENKYSSPQNLFLSDDCVLSWESDITNDRYYLEYYINDVLFVNNALNPYIEIVDGKKTINPQGQVCECLNSIIDNSDEKDFDVFFRVADNMKYVYYDYFIHEEPVFSEFSNKLHVSLDDLYTFNKPENVTLTDDYKLEYDGEKDNSVVTVCMEGYINGKLAPCICGRWHDIRFSLEDNIKQTYYDMGYVGETVDVCIRIKLVPSYEVDSILYRNSEWSEFSKPVKYSPRKNVEQINLAPKKPILYLNNSLYLGKTITPENAYYDSIDWTSSNSNIVSVDNLGKIIGIAVGKADVTAAIGEVSDTVEVTVYDISSNIENEEDREEVTDTAGDIIDDIANNDTPDLENTDISEEDLDDIRDDIQEGIERGDEFLTDIKWFEENFVKYKDNWGQIQKAAMELNAKFAGAYNIEVEMYHKDDEGKEYHIGNIIELDDEITFTFDLPTGMKEEQSGETKKYVLVRIHKNSKGKEEIDTVDYTINDDGTFTTKSDKYSDFVWLEIEEEPTHKHTIVNDKAVEATCTEPGLTAGTHCSVCNEVIVAQKEIPAKGHTITTVPGKEETCTEAGLTEGKKCSVCNTVTVKQETIPAKGHTIVTVPGKEATCTEAGLTEGKKCSVCNTVTDAQKEIPAKGHDYEGKYKCSICGAINPDYKPDSPVTLEAQGIYGLVADKQHFVCGMVVDSSDKSYVEYGWWACKDDGKTWIKIKDWTLGNEWLDWTPEDYGDYVVVGKARIVGDPSTEVAASTYYFYHPNIKGICQLPYEGEGGGYLIGIESFDDTGADYTYEMLILDCTLLAAGKDAWVYTTGRCKGTDNCLWTIWQPQYGYYWTLFRIYDEKGNLVDEQCYGFQNI